MCWRGERQRGRDEGYSFVPRPSLPLVHVMGRWPGNEGREGDIRDEVT